MPLIGLAFVMPTAENRAGYHIVRFTAKQVADVIKKMSREKSPGHDGLSIEHLQHAGVHLPRVLAMLAYL